MTLEFLSTPSGWRATATVCATFRRGLTFLSTPSGWRATCGIKRRGLFDRISIHALRVEGDILRLLLSSCTAYFYPRPPGGGRLSYPRWPYKRTVFLSTPSGWRATFAVVCALIAQSSNFYPRPPGGWRP